MLNKSIDFKIYFKMVFGAVFIGFSLAFLLDDHDLNALTFD
jgi:hypothetical protein